MKITSILAFAAVMAFSLAAHAHDCSGGAGGGMDATGNQCNDERAYSPASIAGSPAASPVTPFVPRHAQDTVAATIKPVATSAAHATHAKSVAQRAPKKYSHRATKRHHATAG